MDEQRRRLAARREHSKGDGNLPDPEPSVQVLERPEDRTAEDLPKEQDPRSAPKGNVPKGQTERNPAPETRDEFRPEPPTPKSGFGAAADAADDALVEPDRPAPRPNARRSSAAKRDAMPAEPMRRPVETGVRRAPKSAAKRAKRAAVARQPQPVKRKTGTARRGGAVPRAARGRVTPRKAKKASRAKPKMAARGKPTKARAKGRRSAR